VSQKVFMHLSAAAKPGYLPTLDGWRAIAIVAVIFHHDAVHAAGVLSTRWAYQWGGMGVDVFFAISGILIGTKLLEEEQTRGRIDLRRFYLRRCLRILPPAFLYLCTVAILGHWSLISVSGGDWWGALLFCRNYPSLLGGFNSIAGWYTSHFWSLSLEEQFYFIFPAILIMTSRKYRATSLALLATAIAAHRFMALNAHSWEKLQFHADTRIDALLVPALFSVRASDPRIRGYLQRSLAGWPWIAAAAALIIPFGTGTAWRATLFCWLMPCIVLGSVLNPGNSVGVFLEWAPLRYLGRISYSLYLWQQLFFREHFAHDAYPAARWQSWPLRLILTFACAIASYLLVERPLARLGRTRTKPDAAATDVYVLAIPAKRILPSTRVPQAPNYS
jgi:peptidoglycan/LPS O-acetylase OafA/YrhL